MAPHKVRILIKVSRNSSDSVKKKYQNENVYENAKPYIIKIIHTREYHNKYS